MCLHWMETLFWSKCWHHFHLLTHTHLSPCITTLQARFKCQAPKRVLKRQNSLSLSTHGFRSSPCLQDHTLLFPQDLSLAQCTRQEMLILHGTGEGCHPSHPILLSGNIALAFVLLLHSPAGAICSRVLPVHPLERWLKASPVSVSIHVGAGGGIPRQDWKRNKIQECKVKNSLWVPRISGHFIPHIIWL